MRRTTPLTATERSRRRSRRPRDTGPPLEPVPRRLTVPWAPLDMLSEEALGTVMGAAHELLEEAGLEFRSGRALALLRRHGADVDGDTRIVRMDRGPVRHTCGLAPASFTLSARNSERTVEFGGSVIDFSSANGATNASDMERGRRYGDFAMPCDIIRLNGALGAVPLSGREVIEPIDEELQADVAERSAGERECA